MRKRSSLSHISNDLSPMHRRLPAFGLLALLTPLGFAAPNQAPCLLPPDPIQVIIGQQPIEIPIDQVCDGNPECEQALFFALLASDPTAFLSPPVLHHDATTGRASILVHPCPGPDRQLTLTLVIRDDGTATSGGPATTTIPLTLCLFPGTPALAAK